jgi:phage regulator Rha-like protein
MAGRLIKIQNMIYEIRGQKVMLDSDLAVLYGVEIKRLNESVKRNIKRFPAEFMFQLTATEWSNLRSQIATFNKDTRKYKPFAFTEHGILMLSSVLNSDKAIKINIQIMKIFVQMRHYTFSQSTVNEQIAELRKMLMVYMENTDYKFSKHDKTINQIIIALNNLIKQPPKTKPIGFNAGN